MFDIDKETLNKIQDWLYNEVYPTVITEQKKNSVGGFAQECWEAGVPYSGASGGGITYCFSPTGLGTVLKVEAWGHEKDFTDYDSW